MLVPTSIVRRRRGRPGHADHRIDQRVARVGHGIGVVVPVQRRVGVLLGQLLPRSLGIGVVGLGIFGELHDMLGQPIVRQSPLSSAARAERRRKSTARIGSDAAAGDADFHRLLSRLPMPRSF